MAYFLKKDLLKLVFLTKLAFPKLNAYILIIYMLVRFKALIIYCRKYSMAEIPRYLITGIFDIRFIPDKLHKKLLKENLSESCETHTILVPNDFFVKFSMENIAYRDGNSLWVIITAFSDESIINQTAIDHGELGFIKQRINAITNHETAVRSSKNVIFKPHFDSEKYYTKRIVQIVPCRHIIDGNVYVTEQEHFNLKKKFGIHFGDDNFNVKFTPITDCEHIPMKAKYAQIAFINIHVDLGNDLLDTMLKRYFEKPILMHKGDVFGIPLVDMYMAQYSDKYSELSKSNKVLYFKCTRLKPERENNVSYTGSVSSNDIVDFASFIVKDYTELAIVSSVNCMVPRMRLCSSNFTQHTPISCSIYDICPYGLNNVLKNLNRSIQPFLMEKSVSPLHTMLKIRPNPIFNLSGPDGCGKTTVSKVLAFWNGLNRLWIESHELMCSTAKQTESKIDHMIQQAKNCSPVLVTLRNFQVFGVDSEHNEDTRLIDYLSKRLNDLFENFTKNPVIFLALTNDDEMKPGISRIFLERFSIEFPCKQTRVRILEWFILAKNMTVCNENFTPYSNRVIDTGHYFENDVYKLLEKVSAKTNTYLFGDLDFLTTQAMECALLCSKDNSVPEICGHVRLADFDNAIEAMRAMQSENLDAPKIPKVYWDDIGGLEDLKREILRTIELPIKYPHLLRNAGLKRSGVLLYGPPGCGKTLVAKALSTELKISFMSVKGPELLNMYVGQSEENVRKVFSVARSSAPCLVFLDEVDALAPARGSAGDSGGVTDRLVSQLLAELDGVTTDNTPTHGSQALVFVIGATNRPDLIEQSLLRPGRLDKLIYVGPYQGPQQKTKVMSALCRGHRLDDSVNLLSVTEALPDRCTGADMMQIVNTARMEAVRRLIEPTHAENSTGSGDLSADKILLTEDDFIQAMQSFVPSITEEDFCYFDQLRMQISG